MTWWSWIVLGVVLAAIELATPGGLFVIFFGVSAVLVGLIGLAGLDQPAWVEWLEFTALALVALALFRKPLLDRLQPAAGQPPVDSLIGEIVLLSAPLGPAERGRGELRGSSWQIHNVGATPLAAGSRGRVVAVNGLVLDIRPE